MRGPGEGSSSALFHESRREFCSPRPIFHGAGREFDARAGPTGVWVGTAGCSLAATLQLDISPLYAAVVALMEVEQMPAAPSDVHIY